MNKPRHSLKLPHFLFAKLTLAIFSINLIILAAIFLIRSSLPPVIPLFYGQPAGEEQLAPRLALALPPALSAFLIIINSLIINTTKNPFLHHILLTLMVVVTILSTITVIKIATLVGSF